MVDIYCRRTVRELVELLLGQIALGLNFEALLEVLKKYSARSLATSIGRTVAATLMVSTLGNRFRCGLGDLLLFEVFPSEAKWLGHGIKDALEYLQLILVLFVFLTIRNGLRLNFR